MTNASARSRRVRIGDVVLRMVKPCSRCAVTTVDQADFVEQLREQVAVLAVAGAEKILKREVDAEAHASSLNELATQL